jgi:5-methylcytosine-specific restriction endonuclease McrA
MPTTPARARILLQGRKAVVVRLHPFTIRLKDRVGGEVQPLTLCLDPGSKATGIAIARVSGAIRHALWLGELLHRGAAIRKSLEQRSNHRRRRRSSNLRYRAPRFDNRIRPAGWLAPSLQHRVDSTVSMVHRLCALAPVSDVAMELVRFDMQALENPEISGVEYQQGTLAGYEVREYLLEKFHRTCAYCDAQNVPLQIEHIDPKANGGSNRVSNLSLSCEPCNQKKGARPVQEFLAKDPERLKRILAQAKSPLKDAAAVNATRWALLNALKAMGLSVAPASGGRTKWNRTRFEIPKTHALDALCVGPVEGVTGWSLPTLVVKATGRGSYQRTRLTTYGFRRGILMREKSVHGFRTGDMVRAVVPSGKNAGVHIGRVAVRKRGIFNIQTIVGMVSGINHKYCQILMRSDGYGYALRHEVPIAKHALPPRPEGRSSQESK